MATDGVILGNLTRFSDHFHLEWVCRDCGSFCFVPDRSLYRKVCARTGREFLVVGIPGDIEPVSGPGPSDLTRCSRGRSVRVRESDLEKMIEESRVPVEEAHHAH
jgi:hypothetical protein